MAFSAYADGAHVCERSASTAPRKAAGSEGTARSKGSKAAFPRQKSLCKVHWRRGCPGQNTTTVQLLAAVSQCLSSLFPSKPRPPTPRLVNAGLRLYSACSRLVLLALSSSRNRWRATRASGSPPTLPTRSFPTITRPRRRRSRSQRAPSSSTARRLVAASRWPSRAARQITQQWWNRLARGRSAARRRRLLARAIIRTGVLQTAPTASVSPPAHVLKSARD